MHSTTPPAIHKHITQLLGRIAPQLQPRYVPVQPEAGAPFNACFANVQDKVARDGGRMVCGWEIWEWPHVLVEAEFHAVWAAPDGTLVDVSPKQHGEARILFAPDAAQRYTGQAKDNVRIALRDDLLVHHLIAVSQALFEVVHGGARAGQQWEVRVPAEEIEPLLQANDFLVRSIARGLRDHQPCLCDSGKKYKACHAKLWSGRGFEPSSVAMA